MNHYWLHIWNFSLLISFRSLPRTTGYVWSFLKLFSRLSVLTRLTDERAELVSGKINIGKLGLLHQLYYGIVVRYHFFNFLLHVGVNKKYCWKRVGSRMNHTITNLQIFVQMRYSNDTLVAILPLPHRKTACSVCAVFQRVSEGTEDPIWRSGLCPWPLLQVPTTFISQIFNWL